MCLNLFLPTHNTLQFIRDKFFYFIFVTIWDNHPQYIINLFFQSYFEIIPQTQSHESCDFTYVCMHAKSLQSCLTLCNPMDYSLPGSSVHRILQERIFEWVVMPSSMVSSHPRDCTCDSYFTGGFFTSEPLVKPDLIYMWIEILCQYNIYS